MIMESVFILNEGSISKEKVLNIITYRIQVIL